MNIVNRSTQMKKPKTPVLRSISHRKKPLGFSIFHEANEPAKMMMLLRMSIAIEIPSTPTARLMCRGANHCQLPVKSMGSVLPAWRMPRYSHNTYTDSASRAVEPATATARICCTLRLRAISPSISRGITTKYIRIFSNIL